ncbi:hypothetical protein D3C87_1256560 [compost metagenome]
MANFKTYINSGFSSCMLLAYARDECRSRDVRLYLIPGHDDVVGVTDGVDAWIAPAVASIMSVNVRRIIDDLRAGKGVPKPEPLAAPRRTLLNMAANAEDGEPVVRRRTIAEDPKPQNQGVPRRALLA